MLELLSQRQIAAMLGVTEVTVYRWKKDGKLPEPDACIGTKRLGWFPATIDMWIKMNGYTVVEPKQEE